MNAGIIMLGYHLVFAPPSMFVRRGGEAPLGSGPSWLRRVLRDCASLALRVVRHAVDGWRRRRAYARTVAELQALNDHLLADLGIERHRIPQVAMDMVYGRSAGRPEIAGTGCRLPANDNAPTTRRRATKGEIDRRAA